MKSVVELEIQAPREKVVMLFNDPLRMEDWRPDVERIEPISGKLGQEGSVYNAFPKKGPVMVARILSVNGLDEVRLQMDSKPVSVAIHAQFSDLGGGKTKLVAEENFTFHGPLWKTIGFVMQGAIRGSHRKLLGAFGKFVERESSAIASHEP